MSYEPVDFDDCDPVNITLTRKQQEEHESVKNERFCVTITPPTNQETSVKIDLGDFGELEPKDDLLKDYDECDESISETNESENSTDSGSSKSADETEKTNVGTMAYVKKIFSQLTPKEETSINDLLKVLNPPTVQSTKPKYVAIGPQNIPIKNPSNSDKKHEIIKKIQKMENKFPNLKINYNDSESAEALQNKYNKMRLESIKEVSQQIQTHNKNNDDNELITWQQFLKDTPPSNDTKTIIEDNDEFSNKVQDTVKQILTPQIISQLTTPTTYEPSDLDKLTDEEYQNEVTKDVKNVLNDLFGSFGKVMNDSGNTGINNVNPFETFIKSFQKFNTIADKYNMPVIKDIVSKVTSMAETGQLESKEPEQNTDTESVSEPELDSDPEPDGNNYAHAEGINSVAVGINSHAEGIDTIATGTCCPIGVQGKQGPKGVPGPRYEGDRGDKCNNYDSD